MENSRTIKPHPQFIEVLFAYKNKVSAVFKNILGIHEIDHFAVTRITQQNQLLVISSTPAMEFNLFNSNLWHFDNTYHPAWFELTAQASWQSLYDPTRYDELYYLRQVKHQLPLGISLAANYQSTHVIFSLASKKSCPAAQELFTSQIADFYKIGQYCTNQLMSIFEQAETTLIHSEETNT